MKIEFCLTSKAYKALFTYFIILLKYIYFKKCFKIKFGLIPVLSACIISGRLQATVICNWNLAVKHFSLRKCQVISWHLMLNWNLWHKCFRGNTKLFFMTALMWQIPPDINSLHLVANTDVAAFVLLDLAIYAPIKTIYFLDSHFFCGCLDLSFDSVVVACKLLARPWSAFSWRVDLMSQVCRLSLLFMQASFSNP